MPRLDQTFPVLEKTTATLVGTLTGNDGVTAIPASALVTLTLTLYVIKADGTTAYVNSRNAQNVLNANNVTVDEAGLLRWTVQVADTTLIETLEHERHYALFAWTASGVAGKALAILVIENLPTVS